jgi:g-D-glutamyl-meso-diaminopimelate peptidase
MLPINLVIDSNPAINPEKLAVGSEIQIPGFIPQTYVLKNGDSIWKLAQSFNLHPDAILVLNQNVNPSNIMIGETITIPKRVTASIVNGRMNYDYKVMSRDLAKLQEIYPFIKVNTIGKSVLGTSLPEIRVGTGQKKIHINASFHANEWITTPILMTFLNEYLMALTNYQSILGVVMNPYYQSIQLSIVPVVNPDGVNLVLNGPPNSVREEVVKINNGSTDFTGWKANIRGVDLNNQYPAKWEIEKERKEPKGPAPRDYPGDAPLTEPEAIALASLAKESRFDRLIALHTQGEEFYWGYEGFEPSESITIAKEFERVSGYKAVRYIDSHAGYKDWFIQEFHKPGFTIELGRGINPLPLSQYNEIYQKSLSIFVASFYTI